MAAALLCFCVQAISQQTVEAGATLHVYTNLLQIPVLILNGRHQAVPPIAPDKFLLHIDGKTSFRPRVRLEGEDPLTMAILIDGAISGTTLPQLSESLAAMARDELHAHDRVTVYGLDGCKLRRTLGLSPAHADTMLAAVKTLEAIPPFQHHWHGEKCATPIALWDAVAWVSSGLRSEPGRRVTLVITNGEDGGSKLLPEQVRLTATVSGVAVFALAERFKVREQSTSGRGVPSAEASALPFITEGSGGLVMETSRKDVAGALARFPEMLRGRYIVEFSRPAGMTAGSHTLVVSVGQPRFFIRNAGTSMPVADPETPNPAVQHGRLGENPNPEAFSTDAAIEPGQSQPATPAVEPTTAPQPVTLAAPVLLPPPPRQVAAPARKPEKDPLDITDEVTGMERSRQQGLPR